MLYVHLRTRTKKFCHEMDDGSDPWSSVVVFTWRLAQQLDELDDFKRLGHVETAVCCFQFRPTPDLDGLNLDLVQQRLQQTIERSGEAWLTTTVLNGRRALRVNINSFLTEQRHIDDLVKLLVRAAKEVWPQKGTKVT